MHIKAIIYKVYVALKTGFTLPYLTKERTYLGVLNALHFFLLNTPKISTKILRHKKLLQTYPIPILLANLIFSGCGIRVNPDPFRSYFEQNYMSAEMNVCGTNFFGVGGCTFASGDSAAVSLSVQGYGSGEVAIISELCRVDWKQRYEKNQTVSITLAALFNTANLARTNSCTLQVLVSPDAIAGSEEAVSPRVGQLYIEVASPETNPLRFPTAADQIRESESEKTVPESSVVLPLPNESGTWLLTRCADNISGSFREAIVLPEFSRKRSCKYQLAVRTESGKKYSGVFLRNIYKADTVLMARPLITRTENQVCVNADPQVTTYVSINSEWKNESSMCYSGVSPFVVRAWTVKRNFAETVQ